MILVACNQETGNSTRSNTTEPQPYATEITEFRMGLNSFDFSIEIMTDEELVNFENTYLEINYADAREGFVTEGLTLIFNFNQPVFDFTLIEIYMTENRRHVKTDILAEVGDLTPDIPFILTHYHTQGTFPRSGFYFVDPAGNERWYTLTLNSMDGSIEWNSFPWSHEYGLYDITAYHDVTQPEYVPSTESIATEPLTDLTNIHIVELGETLFSISRIHNTTVEMLQQLNDLGTSTDIQVGQELHLPINETRNRRHIHMTAILIDDPEALLMNFTNVDYSDGRYDQYEGRHILLHIENTLNDLQIAALRLDGEVVEVSFIRYELGDFNPEGNQTFLLLRHHYELGTVIRTGLVFIDEDGLERMFMIGICQIYGIDVFVTEVNV